MRRAALALVIFASCSSPTRPRTVSPEAVRKACAIEASCLADKSPYSSASACVSDFEASLVSGLDTLGPTADDIQRYVDCAASSSDCTSALECASRNHDSAWCAAHGQVGCDGDLLVGCIAAGWGVFITDCAATKQRCGSSNGIPACIGPPAPVDGSCSEAPHCDGSAAVVCVKGQKVTVDCAQLDSHCVITNGQFVECVPNATDCTSASPDSCSGDSLVMCVNGRSVPTPCSSIGLTTCQPGAKPKCN